MPTDGGLPVTYIQYALGGIVILMLFYVVLVLFKNRIVGSRGEYLKVVDVVAVTQTSRVAIIELAESELYLLAINNDRIYPIDRITNEKVVRRILPAGGQRSGRTPTPPPPAETAKPPTAG